MIKDPFFYNDETTRIGKGQRQIKEITGSCTFCVLPWIHAATRPNGDMRLCCVTNASGAKINDHEVGLVKKEDGSPANLYKDSLVDAFNNDYMKSVRKAMLDNKIPASCTKCFEEETQGIVSKRLWEMYEWNNDGLDFKKLISETSEIGEIPHNIKYFDLRLGHTCNLKCVMCSPHDSSRWLEDYDELKDKIKSKNVSYQISWNKDKFNNKWFENPRFWKEVYSQIPNITKLYFAGGEPLMIKEHTRFLKKIISDGLASKISLRYNSNGIFVDDKIINIWKNFKEVRFAFSIDAIFEKNNYIRYPTNWQDIENSLNILDNSPDNIHCSIACAVQVLNIKHIVDFAKWKIQKKYKKINKYKVDIYEAGGGIINLHLLYIPTFLSARILPVKEKKEIKKIFNDFKEWLWNNYRQDDNFWKENPYGWKRWEGILQFIETEDHSHLLQDFQEYISKLDEVRKIDAKEIFPELRSIL